MYIHYLEANQQMHLLEKNSMGVTGFYQIINEEAEYWIILTFESFDEKQGEIKENYAAEGREDISKGYASTAECLLLRECCV